jgi:hypothetical protein
MAHAIAPVEVEGTDTVEGTDMANGIDAFGTNSFDARGQVFNLI